MKGEAQKAFMKCGSRHKKARSRKLFHLRVERWGIFKIKYFKQKQSSVLVSFRKRKTELKNIEKTKNCIPAMLKPYSASSFCLPNKNRVGVAHGDGTNLEVVYTLYSIVYVYQRRLLLISSLDPCWWCCTPKYRIRLFCTSFRLAFGH